METPGEEGTEKEYLGSIVASVQKGKLALNWPIVQEAVLTWLGLE